MVVNRGFLACLCSAHLLACAHAARPSNVNAFALMTTNGAGLALEQNVRKAPFTVFEFFSADCPVQKSHDLRLIELYHRFQPRGVQFFAVDSEIGASGGRDDIERRARGYPFPILIDEQGRFAESLGATYSTFTVVVDREGIIQYQGGIDSDRVELTLDANPYLQNALDELLAGHAPRQAIGKVFGCMLRRW